MQVQSSAQFEVRIKIRSSAKLMLTMKITFNTMTITSIHVRSSAKLTFEMMMLSSGPTGIQEVITQTHLFIAPLNTSGPGHLNFHAVLLRPQ